MDLEVSTPPDIFFKSSNELRRRTDAAIVAQMFAPRKTQKMPANRQCRANELHSRTSFLEKFQTESVSPQTAPMGTDWKILLWAGECNLAAVGAGTWADFDSPVGGGNQFRVMFDDQH